MVQRKIKNRKQTNLYHLFQIEFEFKSEFCFKKFILLDYEFVTMNFPYEVPV